VNDLPHALGGSIVVGYDGSTEACRAVEHAARLARPGRRLVIVFGHGQTPEEEQHARTILATVGENCGDHLRDVDHETELRPGPAAEALIAAGRVHGAEEIVVGTRGFGGARTWLGSVSQEVLRAADRPVVVVPPKERRMPPPSVHAAEPHPHRHPSRLGTPS